MAAVAACFFCFSYEYSTFLFLDVEIIVCYCLPRNHKWRRKHMPVFFKNKLTNKQTNKEYKIDGHDLRAFPIASPKIAEVFDQARVHSVCNKKFFTSLGTLWPPACHSKAIYGEAAIEIAVTALK